MFDVQVKRIHEYKRQTMNILGVIHVGPIYIRVNTVLIVQTPDSDTSPSNQ